jgi:hypothetical protein
MQLLRQRLPATPDLLSVAGFVMLIAFSWTLLGAFNRLPSWILMFTLPELVGILSYALMISLFDSLLVMAAILIAAFVLPPGWLSRDFLAKGGVLVLALMGSPALFHFMGQNFYEVSSAALLPAVFLVIVLAIALFLLLRIRPFWRMMALLVERSRIFLYIYLPLSLLAIVIVILRNI